jgi:hypothetical protein
MNIKNKTKSTISMNSKISSFFGHIKSFSSQYLTLASFIGIIWGGFLVYDNWRDNNKLLNEKVITIIKSQSEQKQTDSLLLVGQKELKQEVEDLKSFFEQEKGTLNSLQRSYVRYISNDDALTKKDFLEYMEGLTIEEKKKQIEQTLIDKDTIKIDPKIKIRKIKK